MADTISVSTLINYIKRYFNNDKLLTNVSVKGEISNFNHKGGHYYFTLKDSGAAIRCVMFRFNNIKLSKIPKDGDKVILNGKVNVFEETGAMQLYVDSLKDDGEGDLFKQYEELKKKLDKEGYFDDDHKKDIPTKYPEKVAVLVGADSAAMSDIKVTFSLRWPICKVDYYPVPVQGNDAYKTIIETLNKVDKLDYEIIVLSRGGGSFEDYKPFNNEEIVKCIYNLKTFIITGVGHERDYTLVDFVADYRGATPTAAIEHITPKIDEVLDNIEELNDDLNMSINQIIDYHNETLDSYINNKYLLNPLLLIERPNLLFNYYFEKLQSFNTKITELNKDNDAYILKMNNAIINKLNNTNDFINNSLKNNKTNIKHILENNKLLLKRYHTLLDAYSSNNVISRGCSLVYKNDRLLRSIKEVKKDDELNIKLIDGSINTIVKGVKNG